MTLPEGNKIEMIETINDCIYELGSLTITSKSTRENTIIGSVIQKLSRLLETVNYATIEKINLEDYFIYNGDTYEDKTCK